VARETRIRRKMKEDRGLLLLKKRLYPSLSSESGGNMSVHDESDTETPDELMVHSNTLETD
jgi:hypothetical protein